MSKISTRKGRFSLKLPLLARVFLKQVQRPLYLAAKDIRPCPPPRHIGYRIAFLQYRRKFWWIAVIFAICGKFSSANLCESPIFSPYTVIYLLFQLSWLLVPCLTINFGDFLCDLFVELPKFSQILVTSTMIIFVFLPVLLTNLVIVSKH